jgi:HEAT repeat protein
LPEDRLDLYHKATEALLYTWDIGKGIIDEKFKLSHRRRFLEKVAFHLQSIEKGDEAGTMMERGELYNILLSEFGQVFDCEKWEAREKINEFLEVIRTRAGLLVKQASDQYGFVHKTFQEYFAAMWIANESKDNYDLQIMINYVDQFIDNAFWQETLLLALRALPARQTQKILEHILERDPRGIEPYFYHNHYFVMKFIAEQGQWLNNPGFVEKQLSDFFNFSWNKGKDRSDFSYNTWVRFNDWVSVVTDSFSRSILFEKLLAFAEDAKQGGWLRRYCAEAVGYLGYKDQAVAVLLELSEDANQDGDLRRSCAEGLGDLGVKDKAMSLLLALTEDENQEGGLRESCAFTLGKLGVKDKDVVERLLVLAQDENQEGGLRGSCAFALGKLGVKDKDVVERLLVLAQDENQERELRGSCALALGELEVKDKDVVERLLVLAEDENQEGYLRQDCAKAVGKLGYKDKDVVERLLVLAEDKNQKVSLRGLCAFAVGKLGVKDQTLVERLLVLAEDENQGGNLRFSCAFAVGKLGVKNQAVPILLTLAEDSNQDVWLRFLCTVALEKFGFKDKAINILIRLYMAQPDKYEYKARRIYRSLWELTEV